LYYRIAVAMYLDILKGKKKVKLRGIAIRWFSQVTTLFSFLGVLDVSSTSCRGPEVKSEVIRYLLVVSHGGGGTQRPLLELEAYLYHRDA